MELLFTTGKGRAPFWTAPGIVHLFVCQLEGENGFMLTIGVGNEVGCVQHSRIDGDSAYLVALAPSYQGDEEEGEENDLEFLCGNTPSPIPKRNILPFAMVKKIVAYFVATGERSPAVSWEEA